MSNPVSSEQAAGAEVRSPGGGHRGGGHGRRWLIVAVVVVLVAAGVVAAVVSGVFKPASSAGVGASQYRTSSAVVRRGSLVSQTDLSGTLGDAGSYTVTGAGTGTITWLPPVGKVVRRGQVLYRVDGSPVVLLYGRIPAYRALSPGMTGTDVRQLNLNLIALGYTTRAQVLAPGLGLGYYSTATADALVAYQDALGMTSPTGSLSLGQVAFLPGATKITAWETGIVTGASSAPGTALMTATSATPEVTINLDPSQEGQIKTGDHVGITLPDGTSTPGVVSSVGKVASTNASGVTTVPVLVRLVHPAAAGGLSQAPVTVSVTTGRVSGVLVVPVDALQARSGGGYAVEVIGTHRHYLVPVSVGMFDDAAGNVQVSGPGLAPGQRVVVPAL